MPDGIWLGAFVEKYFQGVLILASVLFVLFREALVVERLRRLPRMKEVVGSNSTDGKIRFSQFTLFYRVECEKLFCKTNLKLESIKINKTKSNPLNIHNLLCARHNICTYPQRYTITRII